MGGEGCGGGRFLVGVWACFLWGMVERWLARFGGWGIGEKPPVAGRRYGSREQ